MPALIVKHTAQLAAGCKFVISSFSIQNYTAGHSWLASLLKQYVRIFL